MRFLIADNKYPEEFYHHFSLEQLDAFYDENIISTLYGNGWKSLIITDDNNAFFHVFKPNKIFDTEYFDIEPIFGYLGPLIKGDDPDFIDEAIRSYIGVLKDLNVIAELIRFNPFLSNHLFFLNSPYLDIVRTKSLVFVKCESEDMLLFEKYSTLRKRNIKYARSNGYVFNELLSDEDWRIFRKLYEESMQRVGADKRWFFDKEFYLQNQSCEGIKLFAVSVNNQIASAATLLLHQNVSYYFLAANKDMFAKGACDFLIHNIIKYCSIKKGSFLCLGGGKTNKEDDPLLDYKLKYDKSKRYYMDFYIGKLIVNEEILSLFNNEAECECPSLKHNNKLIKYRG